MLLLSDRRCGKTVLDEDLGPNRSRGEAKEKKIWSLVYFKLAVILTYSIFEILDSE